jgi:tetratricopeptide (TPR) repeat protein
MAAHWAAGGDGAKAIEWYERAAGQSLEGNDFTAALARVGRAVALGASGARLGGLRLIEAAAEYWRGDTARAEAAGREALALLPPGSQAWYQAVSHLNSASVRLGHRENIVDLSEALAAFPLSREASVDQVIAWTRLATSLLTVGETERGAAIIEEVKRAADHLAADPVVSAWLHIAAVIRGWVASDWEACAEHCKRAVGDFEIAGGTRYLLAWRQNLAYAYNRLGLYAEAETVARAAVEAATQLGVDSVQVYAKSVLGVALGGLGRNDEARTVEVDVVERCVAQGDRRLEAAARAYLAEILLSMGDLQGASREIELAIEAGPAVPLEHAHALGVCANVLLAQGDPQRAFETATRAMQVVKSVGGEAEAAIRIAHAEALRAIGDLANARLAIATAGEQLERTAARIRNPSWRESFLTMREHARILQLAREWA